MQEGVILMELIRVENLTKKYGANTAVDKISFTIEKGELFGLLGPNGAGKSTTISMLSGLLKPTEGSIFIEGEETSVNLLKAKKAIGLVPQDIALYPTLTARENLVFWGRMYDLSGKLLKERIDGVLNIVGLEDRKNEAIKNYSGGMKRRINIAAALLHKPEILIMDEPTVGVDPQSRNHILETVKKLNSEGITIIYTSHYMEEVEFLCTRIGIIDHGRIIAMGDKEDLKRFVINQDKIEITLSSVTPTVIERIKALDHITGVTVDDNKMTVYSKDGTGFIANVLLEIAKLKIKVLSLNVEEPNLETVFLNLTGRALRD
jgi:ABC-2 type transport system ATP-binding protein